MSNDKIIKIREDITSDFNGTVIDIEATGEFNKLYKGKNDSREYEDFQQVILGLFGKKGISIFCAKGKEAIIELNSLTEQILDKLERPFFAFNTHFESSVWFHQLDKKIIFDGELQKEKFESKASARETLRIPNYDDPFSDVGKLCMQAWLRGEFDKAIAHNRACLLKERDIFIKRRFREPDELRFVR